MIFFKKEKEVIELILKHVDVVEECLITTMETIDAYLKGEKDKAKKLSLQTDKIESNADLIRYEIRDKLYFGAFLPNLRDDIYNLVESFDEVANAGESCCDFFLNQRPEVPDELKPLFLDASEQSLGIIKPLKEALLCFIKGECPIEVSRQHAREVGLKESDVDHIEWNLTKKIFTSSIEFSRKIHLKLCLDSVALVSDKAKDAADRLDRVTLKSMV
jgi:predicted phosphate transport protein (TIGR00153 family)